MTFGQAIKTCFRKYATFKGRARRAEFWYFFLFQYLLSLGVSFIMGIFMIPVMLKGGFSNPDSVMTDIIPFMVLSGLVTLALLLPSLAVFVRRLHDLGKSGGWLFLFFGLYIIVIGLLAGFAFTGVLDGDAATIGGMALGLGIAFAIVGLLLFIFAIILLVWLCKPGTVGPNRFGPDPKAEPETVDVVLETVTRPANEDNF